jgi:dienelactone hydrolase
MEATIRSEPSDAAVYWKEYESPDTDWIYLGQTPLEGVKMPKGHKRLKLEKDGFRSLDAAPVPFISVDSKKYWSAHRPDIELRLDEEGSLPDDMVRVPGDSYELSLSLLSDPNEVTLGDFLMDRYEVTNEQFKHFVESGGYEKKEYWENLKFKKDGQTLSWEDAMALFKDKTGRPGPATWEGGDYPDDENDHPVAGVSWYEAAAYAEFAGKSLPTVYHWCRAAASGTLFGGYIVTLSNLNGRAPAPVGQYPGMGPFGTYDMAGNVREWCWNADEDERFILGGSWEDQPYMFYGPYNRPAFDRSPTNGFRCIRHLQTEPKLDYLSRSIPYDQSEYSQAEPVPDELFDAFLRMYDYSKTDPNAEVTVVEQAKDWTQHKIQFDAAYSDERMMAYLFLPRAGKPPYQTVVYFPGIGALYDQTSSSLPIKSYDFILKNGRAVFYPIYKNTYERGGGGGVPGLLENQTPQGYKLLRDLVIMWAKDLGCSLDYLATREDVDADKVAYYGVSWGGVQGAIMLAVEKRFDAGIFYTGGLVPGEHLPEASQINFLPRVTTPVLMLNGENDPWFPVETSLKPMFDLLGTPPEHKRLRTYPTSGHIVPRSELIKETLGWLDRYLGPVK